MTEAKPTLTALQRQGLLAPGLHHVATQPLPLPRFKAIGETLQVTDGKVLLARCCKASVAGRPLPTLCQHGGEAEPGALALRLLQPSGLRNDGACFAMTEIASQ